jgi:hypothetical protein
MRSTESAQQLGQSCGQTLYAMSSGIKCSKAVSGGYNENHTGSICRRPFCVLGCYRQLLLFLCDTVSCFTTAGTVTTAETAVSTQGNGGLCRLGYGLRLDLVKLSEFPIGVLL